MTISSASAQQAPGGDPAALPFSTDRSSVTNSSVVVPRGTLQFENGLTSTSFQGQRSFDGPATLMRFGIASKTEFRLAAPDYFSPDGGGAGLGDITIGVKRQLGPRPGGFDVSLIGALGLPTGAKSYSSGGYDATLQVAWSRALSKNWTAAGMLSVYWPTLQGRHVTTGETTFLLDRTLTKKWDAFLEYAGDFREHGGPRHVINCGTSYRFRPRQQMDFHFGFGESAAAADNFIGIGYSFRVQAFGRRHS